MINDGHELHPFLLMDWILKFLNGRSILIACY